jgi:hypothetical protein
MRVSRVSQSVDASEEPLTGKYDPKLADHRPIASYIEPAQHTTFLDTSRPSANVSLTVSIRSGLAAQHGGPEIAATRVGSLRNIMKGMMSEPFNVAVMVSPIRVWVKSPVGAATNCSKQGASWARQGPHSAFHVYRAIEFVVASAGPPLAPSKAGTPPIPLLAEGDAQPIRTSAPNPRQRGSRPPLKSLSSRSLRHYKDGFHILPPSPQSIQAEGAIAICTGAPLLRAGPDVELRPAPIATPICRPTSTGPPQAI